MPSSVECEEPIVGENSVHQPIRGQDFFTPSPSPSPMIPELLVTESDDMFQFSELETIRSDNQKRPDQDEDDYIPSQLLSSRPLEQSLSTSSGAKQRLSKISPRRLSLSLAGSFNQLEIPFKAKRKTSVPSVPTTESNNNDLDEVDNVKLQILNRKEDIPSQRSTMYAEWSSLTVQLQTLGTATQSVLAKLPPEDGKQVVASVVHTVAQNLGITVPADAKPSPLQTEEEVNWSMEVICHGLCLPLEDHMIIRDCVNIYCEWLSALLPNPKVCVPKPVLEDPNHYARKIITHFNHLFVPRKGEEIKNTGANVNEKSSKSRPEGDLVWSLLKTISVY